MARRLFATETLLLALVFALALGVLVRTASGAPRAGVQCDELSILASTEGTGIESVSGTGCREVVIDESLTGDVLVYPFDQRETLEQLAARAAAAGTDFDACGEIGWTVNLDVRPELPGWAENAPDAVAVTTYCGHYVDAEGEARPCVLARADARNEAGQGEAGLISSHPGCTRGSPPEDPGHWLEGMLPTPLEVARRRLSQAEARIDYMLGVEVYTADGERVTVPEPQVAAGLLAGLLAIMGLARRRP